jgi:naphthoate synthase
VSKPIKREFGNRTIPAWATGKGGADFVDVKYQVADGIAKITINRPEVRNAFRNKHSHSRATTQMSASLS